MMGLVAGFSPAADSKQPSNQAILGTIPAYPGAARPLPHFEKADLAIAMTKDKPEAVIAYYIDRLSAAGWNVPEGIAPEAYAAAMAHEPAWLTFVANGKPRLDIQVTQGQHPKTREMLTLIFYQSQFLP
jgi:hypothetical protein